MRRVVILLLVALSAFSISSVVAKAWPKYLQSPSTRNSNALWFEQTIDHFNPQNTKTFKQRYYEDNSYWQQPNGPIFLFISGEAALPGSPDEQSGPEVLRLAEKFGAKIIAVEHRYYGASVPTADLSTSNLQWLSSKQALYDLAMFITSYKETNGLQNNAWFTFGCSYSGALSAWFRLKFPHLTRGSLSSSGVVNAILEFTAFDQQVAASAGDKCADVLRETTAAADQMIMAGGNSKKQIKQWFQATMLEDDGDFLYFLADTMAESVQYGYQTNMCTTLETAKSLNHSLVQVYASYVTGFWVPIFGPASQYSTQFQQKIQPSDGSRQWWYQTCSELAYFQTAPAVGSIRSKYVNTTYFRNHCKNVFGMNLWPDVDATNAYYGAANISATNVYFANGSQDPWQWAGVRESLSASEPALVIQCGDNCCHCADYRGCPGGCTKPAALEHARKQIEHYVQKWLLIPN
jgi:hypothetical protein